MNKNNVTTLGGHQPVAFKNTHILLFALICLVLFQSIALAHTFIEAPESASLKLASSVFLVQITKTETIRSGEIICGSHYHAVVNKTIKGDPKLKEVEFGFLMGLETGKTYKVFLESIQNRSVIMDLLKNRTQNISEAERLMSACKEVLPEYFFFRANRVE
jgi:hypothetical protein